MGNSQTKAAKTAEKQRISLNQRDPHLHLRDQFNIQRTSEYNIQNDPYYNIPQQYHNGYQTATTAAQRSTTSGASGYQTATTAAQRSTTSGASGYQTPTTAAQRSTTSGASSTTTQRSSGYASSTYIPLGTTDSDSIAEVYATDRLLHDYYAAQKATSGTSSTSNTTTPRPSTLATANSAARTAIPSTSGINRAASGTTSATSSGTNRATFNGTSSVTTGATTQRSGQDTANLQWASTSGTSSNATKKKSVPRRADSDPLFNCPGCGLRFGTEIYQCDLSHSSCADCSVCVQCKKPVTRKRNYTLEDVVADRIVPCHNEDRGCDKTMLLRELEEHLMKCFCTEITCPAAKLLHCTWRGVASQLEHHFKEAHPTMNSRANQEIRVRQLNDQYNVNFVTLGEHKFLVHFKVIKDKSVAILVQVLGDNIEASKWTYEWHVYNSNEPKRKFEYADICLHASESVDDKFEKKECGVLPMHYVKNILKCDMFTYKVYLNKPSVFKSDEAPAVAAGNRKRNNRHRRNNRQPDTESTN